MKFIVKGKVQRKTVQELDKFPYNIVVDTGSFIKFELIMIKPEFDHIQEGQELEFYVYLILDKMFGFLSEGSRERFVKAIEANTSTPIATIYRGLCTDVHTNNVVNKIMQETIERDVTQALQKLGYSENVINQVKAAFIERYGQYPNTTLTTQELGVLIKKHIELISELSGAH